MTSTDRQQVRESDLYPAAADPLYHEGAPGSEFEPDVRRVLGLAAWFLVVVRAVSWLLTLSLVLPVSGLSWLVAVRLTGSGSNTSSWVRAALYVEWSLLGLYVVVVTVVALLGPRARWITVLARRLAATGLVATAGYQLSLAVLAWWTGSAGVWPVAGVAAVLAAVNVPPALLLWTAWRRLKPAVPGSAE